EMVVIRSPSPQLVPFKLHRFGQQRRCKIKICPECGRPMKIRNGQYGDFWGCTGYGIKDDQCKVTIKVKAGL
ncbi:topoisomerase DNA-binding C4 zinc finger domain-containing protein, partial [Aeromonas caviae]